MCFTAVNDKLLPLTADTMPVWSGGWLYVPYSVFSTWITGSNLELNCGYSKVDNTVSIYNTEGYDVLTQMLVFDLNAGTCYNKSTGEQYSAKAIIRNGKPYLPTAWLCDFFGLGQPTYQPTPYGYLLRIKGRHAALSDAAFIDAAGDQMRTHLRNYNQSLRPLPETPSTPAVTPPDEEESSTVSSYLTYLAFRCETGEAASAIADTLEQNSMLGLFFFPPEEMERQGALIRRLLGRGHSVGVLAMGGTSAQTGQLLEEGRRVLETVAHARTYFALVPDGHRQGPEQDGWICWDAGVNAVPSGNVSAYSHALNSVNALPQRDGARMTLDDSRESADALTYVLRLLRQRQYTVTIPRETRL